MATKLLLVEDVEDLGRSGDIVSVKPGYARNYLLPQKKALVADKRALQMQIRLQEERKKRALEDKQESEKLSEQLSGLTLSTVVKVDHEGHMYGSVTAHDIVELLAQQHNVHVEKRSVVLKHALKSLGEHAIPLKLKEGVTGQVKLIVEAENAAEKQANS